MKVTDYIVEFLVKKGVTDIFGYPGGVICHLMDSITKYPEINAHINYHEQAAAFAACSYAQASSKLGVAYSTSGPGATNLITGIANAYFDSIPTLFITGQVDTYGVKGELLLRQKGFQETDIVAVTKEISKYSVFVESPNMIKRYLEKAYHLAVNGRPGPVILDIPADVQRAEVDIDSLEGYENTESDSNRKADEAVSIIYSMLEKAKRPIILAGAAIKQTGLRQEFLQLIEKWNIPVACSMPAFDLIPFDSKLHMGFVGVNGHRYANFAISKSDLIICLGTRLDLKQVGNNRSQYALNAKLVRVDIDEKEFQYKVRDDELQLCCDLNELIPKLQEKCNYMVDENWIMVCSKLKKKLLYYDYELYHQIISALSKDVPDYWNVSIDVGQHLPWIAQAFHIKRNQSAYMSAGLGSMGFSLPAAIGIYYATRRPVICFNGDGGIQMNLQELQFIKRERLPIKIIIINNFALGMIRQFQEKNFNNNYYQTTENTGYSAPNFNKISEAYDLPYYRINTLEDIKNVEINQESSAIIEIPLNIDTYLNPNQGYQRTIEDQIPYLERDLYNYLISL